MYFNTFTDRFLHALHVADQPDLAARAAELIEHIHNLIELIIIERAKPLINEQRADLNAPGVPAYRIGEPQGQGK